MKALREAKAYLAGQVWSDKWAELHPNDPAVLLAALVAEIEAAPVATFEVGPYGGQSLHLRDADPEVLTLKGQRVRVLVVGEQP